MLKFKNKKNMWTALAEEINREFKTYKTAVQCENRYKTVLKRKTISINNNGTSGNVREPIEFEEELNAIKAIDDSLQPEILRGVGRTKVAEKNQIMRKAKPKMSVIDKLEEFHRKREEAKQKRHEEKLDLIKQIFNIKNTAPVVEENN